ncbi:hypothetical protein GCK72_015520 [Caenorhabditis remanei]|uniref:Phlebovirus glycoprotein G2 fusion domain-containing protein n=1 Tax=Caenorhabditis remanei TaxID=31234 RepID=A0A6A5GUA6_CAERE|nr:hypothetical protein GCK72_015520 [Caenorhabditis remanei]KAF1759060.1 hypothetical protein GCK72_015520 [Caenorhabditis remanei]
MVVQQSLNGCSAVAGVQATNHVCVEENGIEHCTINKISTLTVRPNGSIACFKSTAALATSNSSIQTTSIRPAPMSRLTTGAQRSSFRPRGSHPAGPRDGAPERIRRFAPSQEYSPYHSAAVDKPKS